MIWYSARREETKNKLGSFSYADRYCHRELTKLETRPETPHEKRETP